MSAKLQPAHGLSRVFGEGSIHVVACRTTASRFSFFAFAAMVIVTQPITTIQPDKGKTRRSHGLGTSWHHFLDISRHLPRSRGWSSFIWSHHCHIALWANPGIWPGASKRKSSDVENGIWISWTSMSIDIAKALQRFFSDFLAMEARYSSSKMSLKYSKRPWWVSDWIIFCANSNCRISVPWWDMVFFNVGQGAKARPW
jgi:hypothetical protein